MQIIYDSVSDGYAAFDGPFKVAVITTRHHQGVFKNGVAILEPMPRSSWTVHWCSPVMSIELLESVLGSLPAQA